MRFWPRRAQPTLERDSAEAFLDFAARILPASYSQRFQDIFGLWESNFATSGYFVEFGALGGVTASNTYTMEKLGWDGVLAEPNPGFEPILREVRSCAISTKCVLDRTGDTVILRVVRGKAALSTVDGYGADDRHRELREQFVAHSVETITLGDLLDEVGAPDVVDWLSIDTEGSESVILAAYDFDRRPIRALCVEHNDTHRDALYDLLTSRGYRRKWPELSGHDDWYVHRDLELPTRDVAARDRLIELSRQVPTHERRLKHRRKVLEGLRADL